jgi:hypothetical protein
MVFSETINAGIEGAIMTKEPTSRALSKSDAKVLERHIEALAKHSDAMKLHAKAITAAAAAQGALTAALHMNTAAHEAVSAAKPPAKQIADIRACLTIWLQNAGKLKKGEQPISTKNMATDYQINDPTEIVRCLEATKGCLSKKGDSFDFDETSPTFNHDMSTLSTGTFGAVVTYVFSSLN